MLCTSIYINRTDQVGIEVASSLVEISISVVCSVGASGYLTIEPETIWVTPDDWTTVAVTSNKQWIIL
ncbi:MAG: hypothetical protein PHU62_10310 [Bacteroidales bacterium]|nr:hypothetical protein [Bacteroidales bacterium]MDD4634940.1 hypothetical protein [Bacteroidales bacterium]